MFSTDHLHYLYLHMILLLIVYHASIVFTIYAKISIQNRYHISLNYDRYFAFAHFSISNVQNSMNQIDYITAYDNMHIYSQITVQQLGLISSKRA